MKHAVGLLSVVLTVSPVAAGQPVAFKDAGLKAMVETQLHVPDPTPADMLKLTYPVAEQRGIPDLTGLEYAVNLGILNLGSNSLRNLSVLSGLTNVTRLYLHENLLTDISVLAKLKELWFLTLADNQSWNCGWEGDAGVPAEVLALRHRQIRNFFTLLMLANGTPMFCAGDEFCHTQGGNNNPYNRDNETTWLDWSRLEQHRDMFRFFRQMIALRKSRRSLGRSRYWRDDVHWYGPQRPVDFGPESRRLAYCLVGQRFAEGDLYVMINASGEPARFQIQEGRAGDWKRLVDTSRVSPEDIAEPGSEHPVESLDYEVAPRCVVVLERKG